jgi:hypothetical protein
MHVVTVTVIVGEHTRSCTLVVLVRRILKRFGVGFLLAGVALQNLGRCEVRTLLLLAGVSICSGAVFTGGVLMRSIESSMAVGFTRLGADMLVVPAGALTNITAALLTAEPDARRKRARASRIAQGRAEGGAATRLSIRCVRLSREG